MYVFERSGVCIMFASFWASLLHAFLYVADCRMGHKRYSVTWQQQSRDGVDDSVSIPGENTRKLIYVLSLSSCY